MAETIGQFIMGIMEHRKAQTADKMRGFLPYLIAIDQQKTKEEQDAIRREETFNTIKATAGQWGWTPEVYTDFETQAQSIPTEGLLDFANTYQTNVSINTGLDDLGLSYNKSDSPNLRSLILNFGRKSAEMGEKYFKIYDLNRKEGLAPEAAYAAARAAAAQDAKGSEIQDEKDMYVWKHNVSEQFKSRSSSSKGGEGKDSDHWGAYSTFVSPKDKLVYKRTKINGATYLYYIPVYIDEQGRLRASDSDGVIDPNTLIPLSEVKELRKKPGINVVPGKTKTRTRQQESVAPKQTDPQSQKQKKNANPHDKWKEFEG